MAAFITVTDSVLHEPVIVNVDRIESIREYPSRSGSLTVIDFGHKDVQCTESILEVFHRCLDAADEVMTHDKDAH
jgi:hypothetical protein